MRLSNSLKKILICGASLVMVSSISAGVNNTVNTNANQVHAYVCHRRRHRTYKARRIRNIGRIEKTLRSRIAHYRSHIRKFSRVKRHTKSRKLRKKMSKWIKNDSKLAKRYQKDLRRVEP